MMKNIKTIVAAIAATSIVSLAMFAHAADSKDCEKTERNHPHPDFDSDATDEPGDGGPKHSYKERRRPPFDDILNLTDAQKKTIESAHAAQETTFKDSREKLRAAHEALDKAGDENADDATLNKLSSNLAVLIAQQEVARIKSHREFVSILTPEQQQKLAAFEAEHKGPPRWKDKQRNTPKN